MVIWVGKALALAVHDRQLAEHGGSTGVRDEKLLESALARPQQLHVYGSPQPDLADLAAALAFGLARNHPFVDGNERVADIRGALQQSMDNNAAVFRTEETLKQALTDIHALKERYSRITGPPLSEETKKLQENVREDLT